MIEGTALDEATYAAALPILMPLPDRDFDPAEAAIPWKTCTSHRFGVAFSTENGSVAEGDLCRLEGPPNARCRRRRFAVWYRRKLGYARQFGQVAAQRRAGC